MAKLSGILESERERGVAVQGLGFDRVKFIKTGIVRAAYILLISRVILPIP